MVKTAPFTTSLITFTMQIQEGRSRRSGQMCGTEDRHAGLYLMKDFGILIWLFYLYFDILQAIKILEA